MSPTGSRFPAKVETVRLGLRPSGVAYGVVVAGGLELPVGVEFARSLMPGDEVMVSVEAVEARS